MSGGPQEYIAYELVLASPAVSRVSGSSNLYSFCDGGQVSVNQLYIFWFSLVLWDINHSGLYNAKSSLYIYIYIYIYILDIYDLDWFSFIAYWLFNAKSSLYIYTKYIGFSLVEFYGISTIAGYLMLNPLYIYIYIYIYIYVCVCVCIHEVHTIPFKTFFAWALLVIVHT